MSRKAGMPKHGKVKISINRFTNMPSKMPLQYAAQLLGITKRTMLRWLKSYNGYEQIVERKENNRVFILKNKLIPWLHANRHLSEDSFAELKDRYLDTRVARRRF